MKRFLLALIIAALWSSTLVGARTLTDAVRDGLVGSVRTIKHEVAEFTPKGSKSVEGERLLSRVVVYDVKGNKVEHVEYDRGGSVSRKLVYTYDTQGRNTGYEEYTAALDLPRKHVYVLDSSGYRVEYRIVQPDGSAGEKHVYKYDASGNRIAEALHDHKGALISSIENSYAGGRLISQTIYNADGSVSSESRNSYDAQGRCVERVRHEGEVLTYRVRYTYDARGRVTQAETVGSFVEADVSVSEAHVPGKVVYVYKGKEQLKETVTYDQDGSPRARVVFVYDARGNWVKKTHSVRAAAGGKALPQRTEYRVITYH